MATYAKKFVVGTTDLASALGSGFLDVLGTPALIAMVENTAKEWLDEQIAETETSVGIEIQTTHERASLPEAEIIVHIEGERAGKIATFTFKAYDDGHLIGQGTHKRAVVDQKRFMEKLKKA